MVLLSLSTSVSFTHNAFTEGVNAGIGNGQTSRVSTVIVVQPWALSVSSTIGWKSGVEKQCVAVDPG